MYQTFQVYFITFRISGEIELGPLDEKSATTGAGVCLIIVLLGNMCTFGGYILHFSRKQYY